MSATRTWTNKKRAFVQNFETITTKFLESLGEPRQTLNSAWKATPCDVSMTQQITSLPTSWYMPYKNPFVSELSGQPRGAVVGLKVVTTTFTANRSVLFNRHHHPYKCVSYKVT